MDKFIKKINTSPLIGRRATSGDTLPPYTKTFGISLKALIEKEDFSKVPRIVTNICEFLLNNGLETEGIFRVNGNNKAVESIKLIFDESYNIDMSNYTDIYAIASVLKLFIRELPDGLIPEKNTLKFVEAYKRNLNQIENCIDDFRKLLVSLPQENYNLLKYLCQFLTKIAEKENLNKMNVINLGIVFGPNIFRCSHDMESLKLQSDMNNIMSSFILHFDLLFVSNQTGSPRHSNLGSSYLGLESTLITQTISSEVHKSSPSLSGDFDLSSSNDNQIFPAPLPTSISFYLHQTITNCVNNHLSEKVPVPKVNDPTMTDDILPEWQEQNDLIDLDDFEADENENSVPVIIHKIEKYSAFESENQFESDLVNDRKLSFVEIKDKIKYLRKRLREFEDNFERQHGCRPQSIEKTGNSQVQQWLIELVNLRKQLNTCKSDNNGEYVSSGSMLLKGLHKLNILDSSIKTSMLSQSGQSTLSGISDQIGINQKQRSSTLEANDVQNLTIIEYFDYLNNVLHSLRKKSARPEVLLEMTKEQLEEEKVDLQKCLLHFEKIYGRPSENHVKQIMKSIYDRYRLVKRLIKTTDNDSKCPPVIINLQTNGDHGNSATTVSSKSRAYSHKRLLEEEVIEGSGKSKRDLLSTALSQESNNLMSQSFTTGNDSRSNYWKQSSSSGSWRSGILNLSQENMSKFLSQNSNTVQRSLPIDSQMYKCESSSGSGSNLKLKTQSSLVPLPVDIQNSYTHPVVHNTPIHSAYLAKSFNSSIEEIIAFRPCNTMSRTEIDSEKEILLFEKRKLQKILKDFEHNLEKITGHRVEKSDRDHMRAEYDRYKSIKCRLRMFEKELER